MKKINKNYVIIGLSILSIVLVIIILLLIFNKDKVFTFSNNSNKSGNQIVNEKDDTKVNIDNNISDEIEVDSAINNSDISTNVNPSENSSDSSDENVNPSVNSNVNDVVNNNDNIIDNTSSSVNTTVVQDSSKIESNGDIVSYFENEVEQISTYNENDSTLRERVKNTFISIIDFIFYDKEINGHTFSELTNTAKLKIIKIALTMDQKIEKHFPNYKEIIKDKYNDIKGKVAVKSLEITSSLCDKVGSDTCEQAKEDFSKMKEGFGLTWSLIKELATSGKNKIKDFYENEFRN